MKKLILILIVLFSLNSMAQEKNALLIIAHGAPAIAWKWNKQVLEIEQQVKDVLKTNKIIGYDEVRVALMEFTKPHIADVFHDFEKQGITDVYAIPLFIAPSGHSIFDIPTILGLSYDKKMADGLKEENIDIVDTDIKITVGPTLNYENVMKDILLDNVKELSQNPSQEALVILAHGDKNFMPIWKDITNETGNYILANTGIDYFDKGFVEIGQSFSTDGVSPILKAANEKNRVIVIGMYTSMGVKQMAENSVTVIMGHEMKTKKMFKNKNIVFAEKGLLPDKRISEWLVQRAKEWIEK
ncbi:MAG: CbiX/SirB N-terminal domain-containing protein [Bacteroidetes bacterium]|nr:CbiX/SirB N-terminal domain-containing protein [Bacteroidota bacterium]